VINLNSNPFGLREFKDEIKCNDILKIFELHETIKDAVKKINDLEKNICDLERSVFEKYPLLQAKGAYSTNFDREYVYYINSKCEDLTPA